MLLMTGDREGTLKWESSVAIFWASLIRERVLAFGKWIVKFPNTVSKMLSAAYKFWNTIN